MAVDSKYNIIELNKATQYYTNGKYKTYQALVNAMKGWTQSQLADRSGISIGYVGQIEARRETPGP